MVLTNDQLNALNRVVGFFSSPDKVITINGAGGTGKTTLIQHIIVELKNKFSLLAGDLLIAAPTNVACNVIRSKVSVIKVVTIHSLCGFAFNVDIDNNNSDDKFIKVKESFFSQFKLVFIDECSMINDKLYDFIVSEAKLFGTKIVFMGDECQLTPVGQSTLAQCFNIVNRVELYEVVRQQKNNPIMLLLTLTRIEIYRSMGCNDKVLRLITIATEMFANLYPNMDIERYVNLRVDVLKSFIADCVAKNTYKQYSLIRDGKQFFDTFNAQRANDSNCKILAFTNARVQRLNQIVRKELAINDTVFSIGEPLIGYDSNYGIINGEEYIVADIRDDVVILKYADVGVEIKIKKLETVTETGNQVSINIVRPDSYNDYLSFRQILQKTMNYGRTIEYLRGYELNFLEDINYNGIRQAKTIDYSYSLTINKAQGSTYDNVFIDVADVLLANNINRLQYLRLFYVASSRTSDSVFYFLR